MLPLSWVVNLVLFFLFPLTAVVVLNPEITQSLLDAGGCVRLFLTPDFEKLLLPSGSPFQFVIDTPKGVGGLWSRLRNEIFKLGEGTRTPITDYDLLEESFLYIFHELEFSCACPTRQWVLIFVAPLALYIVICAILGPLRKYLLARNTSSNTVLPLDTLYPQSGNKNQYEIAPLPDDRVTHAEVCVKCVMNPIISTWSPINPTLPTISPWAAPQNPTNIFELMATLLHQESLDMRSWWSDPFGFSEQASTTDIDAEDLVGKQNLQRALPEDPLITWTRWMAAAREPEFHIPPLRFTSPLTLCTSSIPSTASFSPEKKS